VSPRDDLQDLEKRKAFSSAGIQTRGPPGRNLVYKNYVILYTNTLLQSNTILEYLLSNATYFRSTNNHQALFDKNSKTKLRTQLRY